MTTKDYFVADRLAVEVHPSRANLGSAAARTVAAYLHDVLGRQAEARVIFACAPSQDEFLAHLIAAGAVETTGIDWSRVTAFHMDDYVGLPATHPQSFRHYLREHLLQHAAGIKFSPLPAENPDIECTCATYAALLAAQPIDLICLGIGENGHIAFNDPPVADFEDDVLVKPVTLDDACRRQQVNDGCFVTFADVPLRALTLTIPVFRRARRLSIHVPGSRKARAIRTTLQAPISTDCPASILRLHPNATLYLDRDSAAELSR
jgi:glucosamine-6-phosphate deaminase